MSKTGYNTSLGKRAGETGLSVPVRLFLLIRLVRQEPVHTTGVTIFGQNDTLNLWPSPSYPHGCGFSSPWKCQLLSYGAGEPDLSSAYPCPNQLRPLITSWTSCNPSQNDGRWNENMIIHFFSKLFPVKFCHPLITILTFRAVQRRENTMENSVTRPISLLTTIKTFLML